MNQTAIINIKTEPQVKIRARKLADDLGLSLSGLINAYLKQVIRTKTVTFSASDEEPTEYLLQMLAESRRDIKAGRVISFNGGNAVLGYLDDMIANERKKTQS
ncbi:MAG: type II toxin-antitoxin system RelB/DinJ family antitoxin [Patescibacteria group bacterium]